MHARSYVLAVGASLGFSLCLTAALAQEEPLKARQNLMKEIGRSVGALGAIAKGEKPYDAATVETSLKTINTNAKAFPDLFPAGSGTGETEALPAIWEKLDDFRAKADKLVATSDTLLASVPTDRAGVGEALRVLGADCSSCHETYRAKK